MEINKDYAKAFRYGLMFGKDVKPGTTPISMSVIDIGDILFAVKKAYIDMTPRTFKSNNNSKNGDKNQIDSEGKNNLLKAIAFRIREYMDKGLSGKKSFDDWHTELCDFFLKGDSTTNGLEKLLGDAGKNTNQATFGKAQKIVNMTFKYMYCFDDADSYADKFEPCHIPLDSYILEWFFKRYKNDWERENQDKKLTKTGTYHLTVWSDLKYEMDNAKGEIIPQYKEIQDWIKNHLDKKGKTRLEAEFLIWYEARNNITPYTY